MSEVRRRRTAAFTDYSESVRERAARQGGRRAGAVVESFVDRPEDVSGFEMLAIDAG
jgi:hypothetical protein